MTEAPVSTSFDLENPELAGWLDEQSLQLAGNVSETTVASLQDTLKEGIKAGESVPNLRSRVSDTFQDASRHRAELIARTESHKAANGAGWVQAQRSGVVKTKTWLATADARTRPEHMALHGETVPIDQTFSNGSMFPDDVNCRCTLTYGIDESVVTAPEVPERVLEPLDFKDYEDADDWARDAYNEWYDELSAGEDLALYDYGNFDYANINQYLRGKKSHITEVNQKSIERIDAALSRGALPSDLRVYRGGSGIDDWDDLFDAGREKELIGRVFEDGAYMSTSLNPRLAREFAGDDGIVNVMDVPLGTPAGYVERVNSKGEYEMLLGRGQRFVIKKAFVNRAGKRNIVTEILPSG